MSSSDATRIDLAPAPPVVTATPRRPWLLHGHSISDNHLRLYFAEALGTFVLVFILTATAVGAVLSTPASGAGSVAVPIAVGLGQAVVIAALGYLSGAHVNPAVTIGLAVARRFPWRLTLGYVLAQLLGAIAGSAATWGVFGQPARAQARLGAPIPGLNETTGQVFLVEALGTFILVLVVVAVGTDSRADRVISALTIGGALAAGAFLSGPASGGGLNPARSLAPMLLSGQWHDVGVYLIAPLAGGAAAVVIYDHVLRGTRLPDQKGE